VTNQNLSEGLQAKHNHYHPGPWLLQNWVHVIWVPINYYDTHGIEFIFLGLNIVADVHRETSSFMTNTSKHYLSKILKKWDLEPPYLCWRLWCSKESL